MPQTLELSNLKSRTIAQLRALWAEHVGKGEPPKVKILLLRELAWHAQQQVHGGMDAETRTRLRSAVRQAKGGSAKKCSNADQQEGGVRGRRHSAAPKGLRPQLQPGTQLIRTWHGVTHEVTVLDHGKRFAYRGETYRSLTQIAKLITGAHWSGPRFFGLHRVSSMR